jgi:hypothetical protein
MGFNKSSTKLIYCRRGRTKRWRWFPIGWRGFLIRVFCALRRTGLLFGAGSLCFGLGGTGDDCGRSFGTRWSRMLSFMRFCYARGTTLWILIGIGNLLTRFILILILHHILFLYLYSSFDIFLEAISCFYLILIKICFIYISLLDL